MLEEKKYSVSLRGENLGSFNIGGYLQVVERALDISIKKNNGYGKDNIGSLGLSGVFVRAWDKIHRLKSLVWDRSGRDDVDESVRDTLLDLLNYATYAIMLLDNTWYDKPKESLKEMSR